MLVPKHKFAKRLFAIEKRIVGNAALVGQDPIAMS
jgi:hypothetical protein